MLQVNIGGTLDAIQYKLYSCLGSEMAFLF